VELEGAEGSLTSFGGRACYWEPTWRGFAQSSEDAAERLVPAARRRASSLSSPEPASRPSGCGLTHRRFEGKALPDHPAPRARAIWGQEARDAGRRRGRVLFLQDVVLQKVALPVLRWSVHSAGCCPAEGGASGLAVVRPFCRMLSCRRWRFRSCGGPSILQDFVLRKLSLRRQAPATPRGGYSASSRIRPRPPRVAGRGGGL